MLVIDRPGRLLDEFERLPVTAQYGLFLMALALVADTLIQLGGTTPGHTGASLPDEPLALTAGIVGMCIVLVAVIRQGALAGRRRSTAARLQGGPSHAHR